MMRRRDLGELLLLAAIWGASFLFMRLGAAQFGAVPLSWLRVALASLVLLPLLAWRGEWRALRRHWKPIFVVGITNSALPFALFSYALLSITASLSSIFNSASPLFAALIAWVWLADRLSAPRVAGLVIGFAGVLGLAADRAAPSTHAEGAQALLAILACLAATLAYGFSVNFTKRYLAGVPPLALAAGSQLAAAVALAVPALALWPDILPGAAAWLNVAGLAVLCTGIAYLLYFRLIANAGPANAIAVTYLVPAFAVLWGGVFLGERPTPSMLAGCAVILLGTALATGLLPRPPRPALGR
jgi:drug/metabolite transporter (DMT)-like permease